MVNNFIKIDFYSLIDRGKALTLDDVLLMEKMIFYHLLRNSEYTIFFTFDDKNRLISLLCDDIIFIVSFFKTLNYIHKLIH
jgi:hypothetical protein